MRLSVASVNFGYERGAALCEEDEVKGYHSVCREPTVRETWGKCYDGGLSQCRAAVSF